MNLCRWKFASFFISTFMHCLIICSFIVLHLLSFTGYVPKLSQSNMLVHHHEMECVVSNNAPFLSTQFSMNSPLVYILYVL